MMKDFETVENLSRTCGQCFFFVSTIIQCLSFSIEVIYTIRYVLKISLIAKIKKIFLIYIHYCYDLHLENTNEKRIMNEEKNNLCYLSIIALI